MDNVNEFLDSTLGKLVAAIILVLVGSGSSLAVLEYKYADLEKRVNSLESIVEENKKDLQDIRLQISQMNGKMDNMNLHLDYQKDALNELKELLQKD